jgi:hypothetical protein
MTLFYCIYQFTDICNAAKLCLTVFKQNITHNLLSLFVYCILAMFTCKTPSQVWIPSLDFTGIVPSPDSIFVRNCPRAFLFGCLSMESSCVTAS